MEATEPWRSYTTICRLCLQKDGFMLGIFNHIQGREKSIYKKIMDCTALQIAFGDGLPNVICHRCLYKIEFCLEFRQQCFMSDATLRQINGVTSKEGAPQLPMYERLANGNEEDVVMVVDPTAMDYDSEYDTDNERLSDNETPEANDTFETRNVTMCKFCDYAFTDKKKCLQHEQNAHDHEVPYTCTDCTMGFADRLQYSAHLKSVHQNDKPYNCPQCYRTFARRSDLKKHTIVHTGIKPFTCTVCFKSFSRNTNLSKHMRIHSGAKPFVCPKCPKTFTSKGDLTRHTAIHTGQRPFHCNYCNLSFGRKDKLLRHEKRHMNQKQNGERVQESKSSQENNPVPEYDFTGVENSLVPGEEKHDGWSSSENMVINLDPFSHNNYEQSDATPQREHNSEYEQLPLEITPITEMREDPDIDQNDFSPNSSHITGDSSFNPTDSPNTSTKNFSCKICDKKFLTLDNLRYHNASHSGVRPFKCTTCTKAFIRKRELDRHIATHTGMKPFKCTKCTKSFGRKDKLVRHLRIHDIVREHQCNTCNAVFGRKDALLQHLKMHVKDKESNLSDEDLHIKDEHIDETS